MPVSKWWGGSSQVGCSQDMESSSRSKVQFSESRKYAGTAASSSSQRLPDILRRHSASIPRSSSVPEGGTEKDSMQGGELSRRRKGPAKSVTLDETLFNKRTSMALNPSAHCGTSVGASARGKSFSGLQSALGQRPNRGSSLDVPRPCRKATGLRSRASTGCVSSGLEHESLASDMSALAQLRAAKERLLEVEGLLADESGVLKEYVARCNELQAENAALKEKLQFASETAATAEEETFQMAKELKEVKASLASAKYETSVTRKVQDNMVEKLSEARAEGRRIQTEVDSLRDRVRRMEAFWGPLEAKTAECLRDEVISHIEETLKQYQTMPYRECATMVDVLRNKYQPDNNARLPALHNWFFVPILQAIEEKGRVALLRSQSIIPEGQKDEMAMAKRNQVKHRILTSNRLLGLVDNYRMERVAVQTKPGLDNPAANS